MRCKCTKSNQHKHTFHKNDINLGYGTHKERGENVDFWGNENVTAIITIKTSVISEMISSIIEAMILIVLEESIRSMMKGICQNVENWHD